MAETNGADAAAKKVVMITGGTGLVGCGIKEFVASDAEVSSYVHLAPACFSSWVKICPMTSGGQTRRKGMRSCVCHTEIAGSSPHYL